MFHFIMASALTPYSLLLLIQLTLANARSISNSSELSRFVPACAEQCVQSFMNVHYGGSLCRSRSLSCLCSAQGATSFTLGEGALQCLSAEKRIGACSDDAASDDAMQNVYHMCDDQPNAIQPTHQVITASLMLPSSSGQPVLFPSVTTTSTKTNPRTSTAAHGLPATLVTETKPSPTSWPTSFSSRTFVSSSTETITTESSLTSLPTETSSISSSTDAAAVPIPTHQGSDKQDGESGGHNLNTPQIAGISVGATAGAGLLIGALVLFLYLRRRRNRAESPPPGNYSPEIQQRKRMSTWAYLGHGAPRDDRPWDPHSSEADLFNVPIRPTPGGGDHVRSSRLSSNFGSVGHQRQATNRADETNMTPSSRRISKLLPAKPIMAPLSMGDSSSSSASQAEPQRQPQNAAPFHSEATQASALGPVPGPVPSRAPTLPTIRTSGDRGLGIAPAAMGRDSNITQFEEDATNAADVQVWRPPSSLPNAMGPVYVADKSGNWVLADSEQGAALTPRLPPEGKSIRSVSSLATKSVSDSGSSSTAGLALSTGLPQPKQQLQPPLPVYPRQATNQSGTTPSYPHPSSVPQPLFSGPPKPQGLPARPHPAFRVRTDQGNYTLSSSDNKRTSFETTASGSTSSDPSNPMSPLEIPRNLSPVMESPFSKNPGRVAMPRHSRSSRQPAPAPGAVTQQRQPPMRYPPGQPSPTLGDPHFQQPPRQRRHPGMISHGSPTTVRVVEPSPEPEDRTQPPSSHAPGYTSYHQQPVQPSMPQQPLPSQQQQQQQQKPLPPTNRQHPSPHLHSPYYTPFFSQQLSQSRSYRQPPPAANPPPQYFPSQQPGPVPYRTHDQLPRLNTQVPPAYPPPQPSFGNDNAASGYSSAHNYSPGGTSALLAKRLGNDRAAQMALETERRNSVQGRWHRNDPSLHQYYQHQHQHQHQQQQQQQHPSPQPSTPKNSSSSPSLSAWIPRLTPTRRGNDLFLNVQ